MDVLSIRCAERDGCVVVWLRGELDVATAPLLRARLDDLVADGISRLVLDLEALEFLDAAGLGVLMHARNRAVERAGWLRLVRVRPITQRVLRLARLTRVLPVFASVTQALSVQDGVTVSGGGVAPTR